MYSQVQMRGSIQGDQHMAHWTSTWRIGLCTTTAMKHIPADLQHNSCKGEHSSVAA